MASKSVLSYGSLNCITIIIMDVDVNKCQLTHDCGSHKRLVKKLMQYIQQFIKGMGLLDQVSQVSSTSGSGTSLQGQVTTTSSFREREREHLHGTKCMLWEIFVFHDTSWFSAMFFCMSIIIYYHKGTKNRHKLYPQFVWYIHASLFLKEDVMLEMYVFRHSGFWESSYKVIDSVEDAVFYV